MKPFGYMTVSRTSRWCWNRHDEPDNDVKSQRFRQRRETAFLIDEALGGRDPNNPCDWGDCEYCSAQPCAGGDA